MSKALSFYLHIHRKLRETHMTGENDLIGSSRINFDRKCLRLVQLFGINKN